MINFIPKFKPSFKEFYISETKKLIIENANEAHKDQPQYKNHWDGPEWKLIKIKKRY